jgi:hypothetical protein
MVPTNYLNTSKIRGSSSKIRGCTMVPTNYLSIQKNIHHDKRIRCDYSSIFYVGINTLVYTKYKYL